jgi:hypothetical protein
MVVFFTALALIVIVNFMSHEHHDDQNDGRMKMIFKQTEKAELQDWITPPQVEIVKVALPAERLEWLAQRAKELKESMGSRYLCHEKNRVRRLDGRSYRPHEVASANVMHMQRAA